MIRRRAYLKRSRKPLKHTRLKQIGRRGTEYSEWRQGWLSRHSGTRTCAGVFKKGVKVSDCVLGGVTDEIAFIDKLWRYAEERLELCHLRGRNTHFGAPAKMMEDGVVDGCRMCNAISAGNRIVISGEPGKPVEIRGV